MGERGAEKDAALAVICMVPACDQPAVVLLANDASCFSPEYAEWWACRWHQRSPFPLGSRVLSDHPVTEYGTTRCPVERVAAEIDDQDGTCSACGASVIPSDVPTPSDGGEDCPEHPGFECHHVLPSPTPSDREEQR